MLNKKQFVSMTPLKPLHEIRETFMTRSADISIILNKSAPGTYFMC